jgi:ribonuclease T1
MPPVRTLAALIAAVAVAAVAGPGLVDGLTGTDDDEHAAIAGVLAAVESGQPLPYAEDGTTFENREGLLPPQPLGYYREYTVATPGSPDRGARRLVIGQAGDTWYTNDHYASFGQIDPGDYR